MNIPRVNDVKHMVITQNISRNENRLPPRKRPIIPPTVLRMSKISIGLNVVTYKIKYNRVHKNATI